MISTVVASTLIYMSGIAFLMRVMPSTALMLKNGSTYVDLPEVATTSLFTRLSLRENENGESGVYCTVPIDRPR